MICFLSRSNTKKSTNEQERAQNPGTPNASCPFKNPAQKPRETFQTSNTQTSQPKCQQRVKRLASSAERCQQSFATAQGPSRLPAPPRPASQGPVPNSRRKPICVKSLSGNVTQIMRVNDRRTGGRRPTRNSSDDEDVVKIGTREEAIAEQTGGWLRPRPGR